MISPKYAQAYEYAKKGDIANYGLAVKVAGYATDPKYPDLLKQVYQELEQI